MQSEESKQIMSLKELSELVRKPKKLKKIVIDLTCKY